jgi:hypothetical protein
MSEGEHSVVLGWGLEVGERLGGLDGLVPCEDAGGDEVVFDGEGGWGQRTLRKPRWWQIGSRRRAASGGLRCGDVSGGGASPARVSAGRGWTQRVATVNPSRPAPAARSSCSPTALPHAAAAPGRPGPLVHEVQRPLAVADEEHAGVEPQPRPLPPNSLSGQPYSTRL